MWKSQSPWPAFRGALYDYYLEQTGGYFGVKKAHTSINIDGLHIQLNPKTLKVI
jgi:mannosylglycoprotein endo-beta-mannosidase